jgi:hypothetical protein
LGREGTGWWIEGMGFLWNCFFLNFGANFSNDASETIIL